MSSSHHFAPFATQQLPSTRASTPLARTQALPAHIAARRRDDEATATRAAAVRQDSHLRAVANWNIATDQRIVQQKIKNVAQSLQQRDAEQLDIRRQRLAAMLSSEEQQYREELLAMRETPQQRLQRLYEQARASKASREERRQAFVQEQLERQFQCVFLF